MSFLLDTHTLLWWVKNDKRLSKRVHTILSDEENKIYCSTVSVWEIAIKAKTKKLKIPLAPAKFIAKIMSTYEFTPLPVVFSHAAAVFDLPPVHNDPFDRLLIAQAREEKISILTNDSEIAKYEVDIIW